MAGDLLPETQEAIKRLLRERFGWAADVAAASNMPPSIISAMLADPAARAALAKEWWQHAEPHEAALFAFGPLGDNHHNAAACPYCSLSSERVAERVNRAAVAAGEAPPGMERVSGLHERRPAPVANAWYYPPYEGRALFRLAPEEAPHE